MQDWPNFLASAPQSPYALLKLEPLFKYTLYQNFIAMLEYLRIHDLALIADMELEFAPGMNVLTGETGAGKSFILKALNFLLGERMGTEMVRPGKEKALVEGLFVRDEGELILRRELNAETGRSRLYINGNLGSQDAIRELKNTLLVHTSQHGQQKLLQPSFQAALVDAEMDRPDILQERDRLLKGIRDAIIERDALHARFKELEERRDVLELHLAEIDKVSPQPGEEEYLEKIRGELRNVERLRTNYQRFQEILRGGENTGLLDQLGQLEHVLEQIVQDDETLLPDLEATSTFRQVIADLARRLRQPTVGSPEVDPEKLEARLFELAQLKRKLRRTLPEILSMREEIEKNLSFLDACTLDIRQVEKRQKALQNQLVELLETLNPIRRAAASRFTEKLKAELLTLGFPKYLQVIAEFKPHEYFPGCVEDRVRLLWAPNPGQPAQALDRIASGGELSRFMLAVVSMQHSKEDSTLIFDEVDAGVGGLTLNRVADRLAELALHRQMLLITHWPQLASRATRHFHVTKYVHSGETFTSCTPLEGDAKLAELARMSGIDKSVTS